MALGKGIPVINGFDLNSKLPLDSRTVVDTKENMQKLITDGSVGDGQLCYCKEDKKLYVLKESVWSEVGGGGDGGKSIPPTLNLIDFETGEVRTTITEEEYNNLANGLYNQVIYDSDVNLLSANSPSKLISIDAEYYFTQFKISVNADETFSYSSMAINSITIGEKNTSNEYPITVTEAFTINPSAGGGGIPIVDCTLTDQTDITKGGTVDNVPEAPFLLRIPLKLEDDTLPPYGKYFLDNILVPMNYTYGKHEHSGEVEVVPNKYFGTGFAVSEHYYVVVYYVVVDISTKKVSITSQTNASYTQLPVDLPTKSQPTVTISNPKPDILTQTTLIGNDFWFNGVVLYGYLFGWTSPVYSKAETIDNTTYYTTFYYTAGYDEAHNTFTIEYHEIPITTTITFEN